MSEARHRYAHGMRRAARLFHVCTRDAYSAHAATLFGRKGNLYDAVLG